MSENNTQAVQHAPIWSAYKSLIENTLLAGSRHNVTTISYWRDKLFTSIITFFLPSCLIALLPGVYLSVISNQFLIGTADVVAATLILFISIYRHISINTRKAFFIGILYCLSIVLVLSLGMLGPALVYLLALSVLVAVIMPGRWGYIAATLNTAICIACAVIIYFHPFSSALNNYNLGTWVAVSSNLVFLSFVLVSLINHAIAGFDRTLKTEVQLNQEKLRTLKSLTHSEQRLSQAQALAHFGSWQFSFASGIATWSDETCRIYGLSTRDNQHSFENWKTFVHPDDLRYVNIVLADAAFNSSRSDYYHRIVRPDGTVRHLHSQSQYEFDELGNAIGTYGVAHDITDIKQQQEEIRKSNERFELINKASKGAILDWDIVNDTTYWGSGFTNVFGYQPSEFHNHLLSDNIHPDDKEKTRPLLYDLLHNSDNTYLSHEFRYFRADRTIAHVQLRGVFIRDANGRAIREVASITDITDLVEKQKAIEEQNSALRDIAWTQSHVVRAPLASLMGLVDLLKHKNTYDLNEIEILEMIQSAAQNLDHVVRDVVRKAENVQVALHAP